MQQKILSLTFFFLLFSFFVPDFAKSNNIDPTKIVANEDVCNLSPPAFLNVLQVGTTWADLAWAPVAGAFQFNIITYDLVTGLPVSNIYVPGSLNGVRVNGLIPGRVYYSRIWSVCFNMTRGSTFTGSDNFKAVIIELIVSGYVPQEGEGWTLNCVVPVRISNESCPFPNSTIPTYFNIRNPTGLPGIELNFMLTVEAAVIILRPNTLDSDYGPPKYTFTEFDGKQVDIFFGGKPFAQVSGAVPTAAGDASFYKLPIQNNPLFIIEKLVPNQQFTGDPKGGDSSPFPTIHGTSYLSVNPNPFTDHLDVGLPASTEETDVKINLFDLQGRLVLSEQTYGGSQTHSLSTQDLQPGLYLLRVDTGEKSETIKVLKTQ